MSNETTPPPRLGLPTPDSGVDAGRLAEMLREAREEDLRSVMTGPERDAILGEIFRQMPSRVRAERAANVTGALHWRVGGRADGAEDLYEVAFVDGACSVGRQPTQPPRATMTIDAVSFIKLIVQGTSPAKLVLTRRLRVRGDVPFAMRSEHLFRKPLDDD
jgi:SCP-2 sterol transfer family protein